MTGGLFPASSRTIFVRDMQNGEDFEVLRGDPTLFSTATCLDGLCVSGGARGLVNIFSGGQRIDYKVPEKEPGPS